MTLNTLHRFRPLAKFHTNRHFIYITTCRDETKEEFLWYYKITDEDMEEITKEWRDEFLVPVEKTEFSNLDIIESPMVNREEDDGPGNSKMKKKEVVQEINSLSEEIAL
jgi:hypothetical protein